MRFGVHVPNFGAFADPARVPLWGATERVRGRPVRRAAWGRRVLPWSESLAAIRAIVDAGPPP